MHSHGGPWERVWNCTLLTKAIGQRRALLAGAGLALGLALVALMFARLPLDGGAVLATLVNARPWGLAAVVATTIVHCILSAIKWRLVTRWTAPECDLGVGFYFYMALISLLGQVLPVQLTQIAGPGIALRIHGRVPLLRGAGGAAYDQIFDLAVPGAMVLPVILVCASVVSVSTAGGIAILLVAVVGIVATCCCGAIVRVVERGKAPGRLRALVLLAAPGRVGLLYGLSVARFLNLGLRAWAIGWALQLDISWLVVLLASCGVTFSLLFGFVPGAIGVVEWGWVGMLHLLGVPVEVAATYAVGSRVLTVVALVALNLLHVVALLPWWWRVRRGVAR